MMNLLTNEKFKKLSGYGSIFIRLAFGFHLLYYTWSDVFTLSAGSNEDFLKSIGIPFPYLMSWVYVLTEFIGGIFLIIGFKTRLISIPLMITFLVAFFIVHNGDPYKSSFEALQLLAVSCYFFFNGSGKLSIDHLLEKTSKS